MRGICPKYFNSSPETVLKHLYCSTFLYIRERDIYEYLCGIFSQNVRTESGFVIGRTDGWSVATFLNAAPPRRKIQNPVNMQSERFMKGCFFHINNCVRTSIKNGIRVSLVGINVDINTKCKLM